MKKQTSFRMLVESGIVPQNTLQQLVRWRAIDPDLAERHGSRPVSLEKDSSEAQVWADQLSDCLDREAGEVRETDFTGKKNVTVYIQWANLRLGVTNTTASIDPIGRVVLPSHLFDASMRKKVAAISIGTPDNFRDVVQAEKLHQGDAVSDVMYTLESA